MNKRLTGEVDNKERLVWSGGETSLRFEGLLINTTLFSGSSKLEGLLCQSDILTSDRGVMIDLILYKTMIESLN